MVQDRKHVPTLGIGECIEVVWSVVSTQGGAVGQKFIVDGGGGIGMGFVVAIVQIYHDQDMLQYLLLDLEHEENNNWLHLISKGWPLGWVQYLSGLVRDSLVWKEVRGGVCVSAPSSLDQVDSANMI